MKVYVLATAYNDGVRSLARGPSKSYIRTHGIFSSETQATDKMKAMIEADIKSFEDAVDSQGESRAMVRSDNKFNGREAHIHNGTEFITYRVVQQDISIGVGEF